MFFAFALATAQTGVSSVSGTVVDQKGAAIPGATVVLKNKDKGFTRTATTDESGNFNFQSVPPSDYVVEVEAKGFKKSGTSVAALVDNRVSLNITMEVGEIVGDVQVTTSGAEALINNQDASLGNNFQSKQIIQLPLNARNVGDLLSLQPGVTRDGYVAGGRSDQANLTLDGVDVNEQQLGTAFSPVLRVNPDSVEEFRVTTTNANASQGRSSGAQVSFITKSGTNQFHGSLYEFHRNTVTTANDYFNNISGVRRPKLIRNVFGGSIGGPVIKDRVFFFYNYEGRRDARGESVVRTVPLASLGRGEVRFFTNANALVTLTPAQINALTTNGQAGGTAVVDINPTALNILAGAASRYPANDFTVGDGVNTAGFRFNAPLGLRFNAHTARFDWNLTNDGRHIVSVRGNYQHDNFARGAQQFPDTPALNTWSHPLGLTIGHTWTINNNLVNNFRYGLTRLAFSDQGDSTVNAVTFRDVFSDRAYSRTFSRVTPTNNFTDDMSWVRGNHTFQFGTNIRTVRNFRTNLAAAFDNGITNQSFYAGAGAVLTSPVNASLSGMFGFPAGTAVRSDFVRATRTALAAVIGRLSQYGANFNFGLDGRPLNSGAPNVRELATEEYDFYGQDTWKVNQALTLTLGLRYGLSRPVYETQGFQARPSIGLQDYLNRRIEAARRGVNFTDPLDVELAGPANGKPGNYPWDRNNFQPRVAAAWQPKFGEGFWGRLFGKDGASVFRGGFSITNDYFGQALAVNFDANNTLGFSSNQTISANTYNVTTNPAPLLTSLGMAIRGLPGITVPGSITFPRRQPLDGRRRIEGSLDQNLVSPINYSWNFTYSRSLPKGLVIEGSYVARLARNLLGARDVMALNNIVDPRSGQDWYTAAGILEDLRLRNTPLNQIPNLPFFQNLFPAGYVAAAIDGYLIGAPYYSALGLNNTQAAYAMMFGGCADCFGFGSDWTSLQDALDGEFVQDINTAFNPARLFFNRQYGALSAYGTIASSDYHGGTLSLRQRFSGLTWDLNYTFSKSLDDASGLQTSGVFGTAFILNPLRQRDNRAVSDFDVRHIINANAIWEIPIGRGRKFFSGTNKILNAFIGGWDMAGIFRYNSGEIAALGAPFDGNGWATNWNVRSNAVRIANVRSSPSANSGTVPGNAALRVPNIFALPTTAYNSFRSPRPGETGDRNVFRDPSFITLDAGLSKSFNMPWNEKHKAFVRWEVFNVTNTQRFTGLAQFAIGLDPQTASQPQPGFGNFTGIQGTPRVMQFAFRYEF
jgi:hypothetical protein